MIVKVRQYTPLRPSSIRNFLAVLFAPLCLLPLPDVPGGPLRLDLHDPRHHRGEVPRRLQAHPVQVS